MGIIRSGIYDKSTLLLKKAGNINHFVETGTYYGNTSLWAAEHFDSVETIEFCEEIFQEAQNKLKNYKNIKCHYGDSRVILEKIIHQSNNNMLFWLDAHWSSGNTYGENDQCPLLKELEIIFSDNRDHIILIDDARTFIHPPMLPNDPSQFPSIEDIINAIPKNKFHILIFEDIIYVIPLSIWNNDTILFFQNEAKRFDEEYHKMSSFYKKHSKINDIGLKKYVYLEIKKRIKKICTRN